MQTAGGFFRILALSQLLGLALPCAGRAETTPPASADNSTAPFLESIDGMASLPVTDAQGRTRGVLPGEQLRPGDTLETTPGAAARLAFESTQLLVGGGTKLAVDSEPAPDGGPVAGAAAASGATSGTPPGAAIAPPVPLVRIDRGEIHAMVEPAADATAGKKPVRFIIHTQVAVIGVRGTELVVGHGGEQTSVHTLSGQVEVSHDQNEFRRGQVTPIPAGNFSDIPRGKPIGRPSQFHVGNFMKQLQTRHPQFAALHGAALKDFKSRHSAKRFRQLRERRRQRFKKTAARVRPGPGAHPAAGKFAKAANGKKGRAPRKKRRNP